MPLFEFYCPNCEKSLEQFTFDRALNKIECPNCGGIANRGFEVPARRNPEHGIQK